MKRNVIAISDGISFFYHSSEENPLQILFNSILTKCNTWLDAHLVPPPLRRNIMDHYVINQGLIFAERIKLLAEGCLTNPAQSDLETLTAQCRAHTALPIAQELMGIIVLNHLLILLIVEVLNGFL